MILYMIILIPICEEVIFRLIFLFWLKSKSKYGRIESNFTTIIFISIANVIFALGHRSDMFVSIIINFSIFTIIAIEIANKHKLLACIYLVIVHIIHNLIVLMPFLI